MARISWRFPIGSLERLQAATNGFETRMYIPIDISYEGSTFEAAANSSRLASSDEDSSPFEMTNKKPKINKRPTASSSILAYFKETDAKRAEERKLQAQAAEKRDDERKRKADLQEERMDSRESLKREQYEEMVQLKRRKYDLLERFISTLERKK